MIRLNCFFTLTHLSEKETFLALAQELVEKSRQEKGNAGYDVFFSCVNPLEGMICETWHNQASLEKHATTEHFAHLVPQIKALTAGGTRREKFSF